MYEDRTWSYKSEEKTVHTCFLFCVYTDFNTWIYTEFYTGLTSYCTLIQNLLLAYAKCTAEFCTELILVPGIQYREPVVWWHDTTFKNLFFSTLQKCNYKSSGSAPSSLWWSRAASVVPDLLSISCSIFPSPMNKTHRYLNSFAWGGTECVRECVSWIQELRKVLFPLPNSIQSPGQQFSSPAFPSWVPRWSARRRLTKSPSPQSPWTPTTPVFASATPEAAAFLASRYLSAASEDPWANQAGRPPSSAWRPPSPLVSTNLSALAHHQDTLFD